ncbi:hypothetical protein [Prosthecobacter sp.]|uniref:hypothetical protein n=1 Tax=Prosthecobacter sp. TaxID=1965333 RepID=UPI0037839CC1
MKKLAWLPPQIALMKRFGEVGMIYFEARRQFGKTTTFAGISLRQMMKHPGRLVTFASASINVGKELIYKEAAVLADAMQSMKAEAEQAKMQLGLADSSGKEYKDIDLDGIADLFERSRLEMRLHHSRTMVSRTQIIAPNPATARGFSGDVLIDEIGFIPDFSEVWEAMEPIASRDPTFRVLMASTPPPDESHLCYKIGLPPNVKSEDGRERPMEFTPCADGHWYESDAGVLCLRVDVYDAEAAGVKLYDLKTREPIPAAQHRAKALDKDAWDRNYGLKRIPGGLVAMPSTAIDAAQAKGAEDCLAYDLGTIETDKEGDALARVVGMVQTVAEAGQWGAGYDIATTTNAKSNPSSITLTQGKGAEKRARLIVRWKSASPNFSKSLVVRACETLRTGGGQVVKVCLDGSNEKYYADLVKTELEESGFTVGIIVSGETVENPDNPKAKMRLKEKTGNLLVNIATDRLLALPPDKFVKDDFLLEKKEKGLFVCDLDAAGNHGDTFDSTKLSVYALESGGSVEAWDMPVGEASGMPGGRSPHPSWMREELAAEEHRIYG